MTVIVFVSLALALISLGINVLAIRWHHQDRMHRKSGKRDKQIARHIIALIDDYTRKGGTPPSAFRQTHY